MDKAGRIFTAEQCRKELEEYKKKSAKYASAGKKQMGISLKLAYINSKRLIYGDLFVRMLRSAKRRLLNK